VATLWISRGEDDLVPLEAQGYASEKDFQAILADNPEVLASALDAGAEPAKWLLIDRELPILSDEENERTRWKLDHLFIDGEGVPTLVEVKRSGDPRARREVVAQMLDYAASFASDWSAERLRGHWRDRERPSGLQPEAEMDAFLESSMIEDEDSLWVEVDTKIAAGRFRLLFVADQLSPNLVRIIEYLNDQFERTEVLGIEVAQHVSASDALVAYQPLVRGRTAATKRKTSTASERRTRDEFSAVLRQHHGESVLTAVNDLVGKAEALGAFVSVGAGERSPRLFLNFRTEGSERTIWPIAINPRPGKVALFLRYLKYHPSFEDDDVRLELVERMSTAVDREIDRDRLGGFPGFHVSALTNDGAVDRVVDVLRWAKSVADAQGPEGGSS
jgi:hypothetical protein